jgi:hypothetical protein
MLLVGIPQDEGLILERETQNQLRNLQTISAAWPPSYLMDTGSTFGLEENVRS